MSLVVNLKDGKVVASLSNVKDGNSPVANNLD